MASCHKNNSSSGGSTKLVGNYTFLYGTADITLVESVTLLGQTASLTNITSYKTLDNVGTVQFTADSMKSVGVGYSVDTITMVIDKEPGQAPDTAFAPFAKTIDPVSYTSHYQVIGTDSIYSEGGFLASGSLTAGTNIAPPSGGHFSFSGDTLIITSKVNMTYPDHVGGTATTANLSGNAVFKLLKK